MGGIKVLIYHPIIVVVIVHAPTLPGPLPWSATGAAALLARFGLGSHQFYKY